MSEKLTKNLLPLFKKRFSGFLDFQQGDPKFSKEEDYKRDILKSWEASDGISEVRKLTEEGRGCIDHSSQRLTLEIPVGFVTVKGDSL